MGRYFTFAQMLKCDTNLGCPPSNCADWRDLLCKQAEHVCEESSLDIELQWIVVAPCDRALCQSLQYIAYVSVKRQFDFCLEVRCCKQEFYC